MLRKQQWEGEEATQVFGLPVLAQCHATLRGGIWWGGHHETTSWERGPGSVLAKTVPAGDAEGLHRDRVLVRDSSAHALNTTNVGWAERASGSGPYL